jgi:formylglycine-generating enzyme required for sulfatase activity
VVVFCGALSTVPTATADTFGSGLNSFEIEFVKIGAPGNPPDTTDRPVTDGAVPYKYRIGRYEVSEQMIDKANALGALGITHDGRGANFPATSISWYEAAQFVNWLNESTGHPVAYKFDVMGNFLLWEPMDAGYDPNNLYRNSEAFYFLPTLSEWHKAAYYDPVAGVYYDYPTGSDAIPDGIDSVGDSVFDAVFEDGANQLAPNVITNVGLSSPYGTFGQGGNAREWLEIAFDRMNTMPDKQRMLRGGAWGDIHTLLLAANDGIGWAPSFEGNFVGLRVASAIPEPSAVLMLAVAILQVLCSIRRKLL